MQAKSISGIPLGYLFGMTLGRPPKSKRSDFGQRLQLLREEAGLTQREVAAALGIAQPSYVKWERRDISLTVDQLKKLASILDVAIEVLLGQPKSNPRPAGRIRIGKAQRMFEAVSKLPRRQQEKIFDILEPFVKEHRKRKAA